MSTVSLTPKEVALLTSFIQELGGIPSTVNFQSIAEKNGIKYGKNARSSFNKLLDKIMNNGATENGSPTTAANRVKKVVAKGRAKADASDNDAAGAETDDDETYGVKKGATKKSAPKNGVAKLVNSRKTPSRPVRKTRNKVKVKPIESEVEDDQDEEMKDRSEGEPEDQDEQDEEGKASIKPASANNSAFSSSPAPYVPTAEDIRVAHLCSMSVEDYVAWKDQNQYNPEEVYTRA